MCGSFWDAAGLVKRYTHKQKTVGVNQKCSDTHNTPLRPVKGLPKILNCSGNPVFNSAHQL